jgi:eukaryotic-like serine/threonine-protein kinase
MLTGMLGMPETESKDMLSKMLKRSFGAIKPISEQRYAPDEEISRIIEKMMKMDLKARYQKIDDVVADLERYAASIEPEPTKLPLASTPVAAQRDAEADLDSIFGPASAPEPAMEVHAGAEQLQPFEVKAVVPKSVLCVESQAEIQNVLRKNLSGMGYRVMLVADAEVAAERYREAPVDAVIFDTDGQGPESIDAFTDMHEKAVEDGHQLVAVVIIGPKQQAIKEKLPTGDRLIVLSKPIKMKQVQDAIAQLLPLS